MAERIWLVGWTGDVPDALAGSARRLPVAAIFRRQRERPRAVVLGDDVIARVHPADARAALASVGDRLIICAPRTDPGRVTPWRAAWDVEVVTVADLARTVHRIAAPFARPRFPPEAWLPQELLRDGEAADLATLVPTLPYLHVAAWADARGVSPRTLERACRRAFGVEPRRVLDHYRDAALLDLGRRGATLDDCADALAMSGASAVSRARTRLRRRADAARRVRAVSQIVKESVASGHSLNAADALSNGTPSAAQSAGVAEGLSKSDAGPRGVHGPTSRGGGFEASWILDR